jgi:8-oxo-dGTP pyrophosphatase MutT (NUDIX family)
MFCLSPKIIQKIFMKNSISNLLANSSTNSGSLLDNRSSMRDNNYRSGVGIMIINSDKKIFVGKRVDNKSDAWQMPQGGIDAGENEELAMFRELQEETGIEIKESELEDLTQDLGYNAAYTSCGGCDEYMKFFLLKKQGRRVNF